MTQPDTGISEATNEKLDSIGKVSRLMKADGFVLFKAKGCTVTRDLDAMTDKEKARLIDALMWSEDNDHE